MEYELPDECEGLFDASTNPSLQPARLPEPERGQKAVLIPEEEHPLA